MPFDALPARPEPKTLAQAIDERRIVPIGWAGLDAHKQAQLARYHPSFWLRHEAWLPLALVGSVGCMAASGGLTHQIATATSLLSWSPTLIWLGCFALLIVFGVFRVHAGAHWQERIVRVEDLDSLGVPAEIATAARTLHRDVAGSELILGELIQQEVVLDPYLIVACNAELACLGIWDDSGMIACAGFDTPPAPWPSNR